MGLSIYQKTHQIRGKKRN
ncbi:hypothetical protein [Spiroplasma endosymbiont of Seladonia tumulorum]